MSFAKSNTGQALWLVLSSLSKIGISLISVMILSRYFDKSSYGTYRQIIFVYNSLLVIFSAGLPKIFAYFLPKIKPSQGKEIVIKVSTLLLILGAGFSLFLFLLAGEIDILLNNPKLEENLRLFAFVPVLLLPTMGLEGIFTSYKKSHLIAIYETITKVFLLCMIILPVVFIGPEIKYAIYGWIIGSGFSLILAIYFKSIPYKNLTALKSGISTKDILMYSLPLVLASLSGILIKAADQFFISRYFGEEIFAEFSNGFTPLPFVGMISGSAAAVLMPMFSKHFERKEDVRKIITTFKSVLIKSGLIIYPIVIFCFINAEETIMLLFSSEYINSVIYFRAFLVLHLFNIIIFAPLLLAAGETAFYWKVHFYFAVSIWVIGYFVVIFFENPYFLAFASVTLAILLRSICMVKASKVVNAKIYELVPFKTLGLVLLHCSFIMYVVRSVFNNLNFTTGISFFMINLLLSVTLILITAKLLKLDYLLAVKPIFQKLTTNLKKP